MRSWPKRSPQVDQGNVGITFVDVLFALVIGEILEPLRQFDAIPGPGRAHLALAALLTLASWIGYHNSHNRPRHFIRFPNLPLLQFMLDIGMVIAYWLTAVTAEGAGDRPSSRPEATAVAVSFVLYVLWDVVAYRIRRDDRYYRRPLARDVPARRDVTRWAAAGSVVIGVYSLVAHPRSAAAVYLVDALLVLLVVGFRLLKEYVTVDDPFAEGDLPSDESTATSASGSSLTQGHLPPSAA